MEKYTLRELREIAKKYEIPGKWKLNKTELIRELEKSKQGLINMVNEKDPKESKDKKSKDDEHINKRNGDINRYFKLVQLGSRGKEGTTYMVADIETKKKYAMKTFKKTKSPNTLLREIEFQRLAHDHHVAPKVVDYNLEEKWIVMDLLDRTLLDILNEQNNTLTEDQQKQIIQLFENLDKAGIVHNDANPLNIMELKGKFYMIDYGFSKFSNHKDFKDYGEAPNVKIMTVGLILWMKKIHRPVKSWTYILSVIPDHLIKGFGIDKMD